MKSKGKDQKAPKRSPKPLRGARTSRNNATSAFQMKREEWGTEIYGLRCLGYSYRQIQDHMQETHAPEKFSIGRVYELFQLGRTMRLREKLDEVFDTHVDRLAIMREGMMTAAAAGDPQAVATVMKIDETERNLLGIEGRGTAPTDEDPKASLQAKLDAAMKRLAPKLVS